MSGTFDLLCPTVCRTGNGYFTQEGLDLDLVTGYGADKTMAAVISGEAQIGFMGAEASVYAYLEGANDPVINFAQEPSVRETFW